MYRVHIKDKMSTVLFLVDLAGSERLKISEAGVRKTETQHINKSLSALSDVCAALVRLHHQREVHLTFRIATPS